MSVYATSCASPCLSLQRLPHRLRRPSRVARKLTYGRVDHPLHVFRVIERTAEFGPWKNGGDPHPPPQRTLRMDLLGIEWG